MKELAIFKKIYTQNLGRSGVNVNSGTSFPILPNILEAKYMS